MGLAKSLVLWAVLRQTQGVKSDGADLYSHLFLLRFFSALFPKGRSFNGCGTQSVSSSHCECIISALTHVFIEGLYMYVFLAHSHER